MIELASRVADKIVGLLSRRGFLRGLGKASLGATSFLATWAASHPAFAKKPKPPKKQKIYCCEFQEVFGFEFNDQWICSESDDTFFICYRGGCPQSYELDDCDCPLVSEEGPYLCDGNKHPWYCCDDMGCPLFPPDHSEDEEDDDDWR